LNDTGIDFIPLYEQAFFYNAVDEFTVSHPRFVALLGTSN